MMLPKEIADLLRKHENGRYAVDPDDHDCEGAKFHSPRPLRVHPYVVSPKRIVFLCGTCRDNLGVYLSLWEAEKGLDWPTQRSFGNQLRALAHRVLDAKGTK